MERNGAFASMASRRRPSFSSLSRPGWNDFRRGRHEIRLVSSECGAFGRHPSMLSDRHLCQAGTCRKSFDDQFGNKSLDNELTTKLLQNRVFVAKF
mmetsp:Transcript_20132/g.58217  ORF Transcript_20132/g.58217 Transcript_20132/m.58217 type:complete len:96 (+) Transcript_20132:153-440(+)